MITRHRRKSVFRRLLMPLAAVGFLSYSYWQVTGGAAQTTQT